MNYDQINPENTVFILISFEGPDGYSMAGGLGVRMNHLSRTLARMGYTTHLFFIGDPSLPGKEVVENGRLILHRWCQWISKYHPGGVYDGEEGKLRDFTDSIPQFVADKIIQPAINEGRIVAVLGEEWQVAEALCRLSDLLYFSGIRNNVILFWNANNTYSFQRVNWARLNIATTITTISRYMKHIMERMGLNPLVIPNGIPRDILRRTDDHLADILRSALGADILICKVARWDPDKRWMEAIDAAAKLKELKFKSLFLARGGREPYGRDVIRRAQSYGLLVKEAPLPDQLNFEGYLNSLKSALPADVIDIPYPLPLDFLAVMYRASDAVLANSGHEPFGIVGLEAMAAGGIVFTGSTGEDYAIPSINSVMIETADPMEMVGYIISIKNHPQKKRRMQVLARLTAHFFTWESAVQNLLGKLENQARIQGLLTGPYLFAYQNQTAPFTRRDVTSNLNQKEYAFNKAGKMEQAGCSAAKIGKEVLAMPRTSKSAGKAAGGTVKKEALKVTREQAMKFLAKVPEQFVFWSNDGKIFRDLNDLKDGLETMSDDTFAYHSNAVKKDFSNWIRDIIGDEKLAADLEKATDRREAARIVAERYAYLMSQIS